MNNLQKKKTPSRIPNRKIKDGNFLITYWFIFYDAKKKPPGRMAIHITERQKKRVLYGKSLCRFSIGEEKILVVFASLRLLRRRYSHKQRIPSVRLITMIKTYTNNGIPGFGEINNANVCVLERNSSCSLLLFSISVVVFFSSTRSSLSSK